MFKSSGDVPLVYYAFHMGDRAQGIINSQILEKSDILVAIFWHRLGTGTGVAESGTIEEIENHLKSGRPAMIYFSSKDVPRNIDTGQLETIRRAEKNYQNRGLIDTFENPDGFRQKFTRHLAARMVEYLKGERPKDAIRVSMGNDLKSLGTLSTIAEKMPLVATKASWEILGRNVIETAKFSGLRIEGGSSDLSQAVPYLSVYGNRFDRFDRADNIARLVGLYIAIVSFRWYALVMYTLTFRINSGDSVIAT